jgi:hypothetical protein
VLLVEGETEQAFLDELRKSHSSWFLDLNVDVYGGNANRKPGKVKMLFDRYARQGYSIFMVGDADGKNTDIFERLVDDGLVTRGNTFRFCYDFESSIPLGLLHHVLVSLGLIVSVPVERFREILEPRTSSVLSRLKNGFSLDAGSHKVAIAQSVAHVLNNPDLIWWKNDGFTEGSELGQFLRFIQRIM